MSDKPENLSVPEELEKNVFLTTLDSVYNWGRARSMWPMAFGLACCAIEFMAVGGARFDLSRFGMEIMRASPRQADLMIVSGTVTKKMVPNIVRLYNQMAEPKYVMAMGACATSGGPFKEGYNVVSGIDKFVPVDVYVSGCPPTPDAVLYGFMKVHEKVFGQSISTAPWYKKEQLNEAVPVPILGPDLYDPSDREALKVAAAKAADAAAAAAETAPASRLSPEEAERLQQWLLQRPQRGPTDERAGTVAQQGAAPQAPAEGVPAAAAAAVSAPAAAPGGRLSPEEIERRRAEARARKAAQQAEAESKSE